MIDSRITKTWLRKVLKVGEKKRPQKDNFRDLGIHSTMMTNDVYIAPTRPILSLFSEANIFKIFIYKLSKNDYCCLSS